MRNFYDLYSSPDTAGVIKSMVMRYVRYVHMWVRSRMHKGVEWETRRKETTWKILA